MPVFLMVFILLIAIIRMAMSQMALQDAAAQTARLTSAHMYPIQLAVQSQSGASAPQPGSRTSDGQPNVPPSAGQPVIPIIAGQSDPSSLSQPSSADFGTIAAGLAGYLPEPAGPLLEAALQGDWDAAADIAAGPLGEAVFGPLIRKLASGSALAPDRIRVTRLSLPDLANDGEAYFRIRLAYDFPLALPFTGTHVTLSADAEERVWVADPVPAPTFQEEEDGAGRIVIVSIEPSPLRPGRKAKLTAIGKPNAKLNLVVWYKSGRSKAKNLGEKTADEHGIVTWEWHVSGNTTPGAWELEVSSEDGAKAHSFFIVQKAGGAGP